MTVSERRSDANDVSLLWRHSSSVCSQMLEHAYWRPFLVFWEIWTPKCYRPSCRPQKALPYVTTREWTIIRSVSYRIRYWVYCIESYRLLLYRGTPDIMCITADSAAVNGSHYTGQSKDIRARYRTGLEGQEEGDCNLIPASPWHQGGAVLGLGHQRQMMLHPLHQQEMITTVNSQSL